MQELDISGNHLEILDETSLRGVGVSSLEKLNASDCLIYYIHEEAFVRQSKLQTVDLSRNKLVFIEPNTFIRNPFLNTLSLANNELLELPEGGSFLNTKSLKVLDLSACNLSNIPPNTFQELPNLETLYISHNKLTVLPLLQRVEHLNTLDLSHNYLTDFNSGVFSSSPKLMHLNLSYNKLSTLNTTVMSQLAQVSIPEDLKGNPWVCDCMFYTIYFWCSSHGVDLEIVCLSPPKCNDKLWTDCYKAGCDGSDIGVDQVEEMERMDYTTVPSEWLEKNEDQKASDAEEMKMVNYTRQPGEGLGNHGKQKASDSEEMTLIDYTRQPSEGLGSHGKQKTSDSEEMTLIDYTRQPSERLENHGYQEASDSFGIRKQTQEIIVIACIIVCVCIAVVLLLLNASRIVRAIEWCRSKSRRSRVTGHAKGDPEACLPLQKKTECRTVGGAIQNSYCCKCVSMEMMQYCQTRRLGQAYNFTPLHNHTL